MNIKIPCSFVVFIVFSIKFMKNHNEEAKISRIEFRHNKKHIH